jgi:hypothetical protein
MPPKHLAFPAAIQADDMITVNRSPNRHRGASRADRFCCGFAAASKSLMDGRDQDGELSRRDLIAPNIGGNDFCSEFGLVVGHRLVLRVGRQTTIPAKFAAAIKSAASIHNVLIYLKKMAIL